MEDFYVNYNCGYEEDNPFAWSSMIEVISGIFKDGTKEEYDNHNKKVAYTYLSIIENEEFTKLPTFNIYFINRILKYLNHDEKYVYYQQGLINGTLITNKNRSLSEAILDKKAVDLAIVYVLAGIQNFKLHALCIMYQQKNYQEEQSLFSSLIFDFETSAEYKNYVQNILSNIEELYKKIVSIEEKKYVLNNVAEAIKQARISPKFGTIKLNLSDFQYGRELKRILISNK